MQTSGIGLTTRVTSLDTTHRTGDPCSQLPSPTSRISQLQEDHREVHRHAQRTIHRRSVESLNHKQQKDYFQATSGEARRGLRYSQEQERGTMSRSWQHMTTARPEQNKEQAKHRRRQQKTASRSTYRRHQAAEKPILVQSQWTEPGEYKVFK